jgi:hypothetical protein
VTRDAARVGLQRVVDYANKRSAEGAKVADVAWLAEAAAPWSFGLPLFVSEIEAFARGVFAR